MGSIETFNQLKQRTLEKEFEKENKTIEETCYACGGVLIQDAGKLFCERCHLCVSCSA